MALCTVIADYITSMTKELKFLSSDCSIVCSYCSVVCLITKNGLKTDRIFKFFETETKFTWLMAVSTRIPKCNFFPGRP